MHRPRLPDGQRDSVIEARYDGESAMPFSTVKIDWTYDALNRLRVEQRDEGNDGQQNGGDYTDTFAFDLAGNRIRRIHDAVGTAQDETVLSIYDGRDRLISADSTNNLNDAIHAYDLNGSTISVTTAGGTMKYRRRGSRSRRHEPPHPRSDDQVIDDTELPAGVAAQANPHAATPPWDRPFPAGTSRSERPRPCPRRFRSARPRPE